MTAYQRIADSLRQKLLSGAWEAGQQLPTERALCRQFDVSQITVRRALQILEQERLVERRQGSGTFAKSTALRKIPILSTDFFGSIRRHAPRLERRLYSWQWGRASDAEAALLQATPDDAVLQAVRIDELQDEPVTLDEVSLVGRYADRLDEDDLAQLDFLRRWQTVQEIRLDYCSQTIEGVKAKSPISRLLQVRAREPLLKETSVLFLSGRQPAGMFVSYYRHDCFRFDATFELSGL
jgi:GntR family transcriptional regulator